MRITFIGSGNVATHLAAAFKNAGHRIVQIYSPTMHNAALLAYHVGAEAADNLGNITADTDVFILSIKDDAITGVAAQLVKFNKLIAHTSGAVHLEAIRHLTELAGVFYPLQTFSKTKELDFRSVPICIEGADEIITTQLEELAQSVSNKVYRVSSAQRKVLHLAAVFACNFTNHLYAVSQQLLAEHQLDFDMLRPLIAETADKVMNHSPADVQTGPAIRRDEQTMVKHLAMLDHKPQLHAIYQLLSQDIIKNQYEAGGAK